MKRFILLIADLAALYGALLITLKIRYEDTFALQYHVHLVPFAILFVLWILVFYTLNLYDTRLFRNNAYFYSAMARAIATAGAVSVIFFYLIPIYQITPRANLALFIVVFAILNIGIRSLFNGLVETRFRKRIAIVGINPQSLELAYYVQQNPQFGYELSYLIDIQNSPEAPQDIPVMKVQQIAEDIKEQKLEAVIVSPQAYQVQEIIDLFFKSLEHRVNFYNLPSFYEKMTGRVPLGAINQIWFLENITEETRKGYEALKRGIDITFAAFLGIGFAILFPIVAILIKLDSRGPIFYRQKRLGRAGKTFEMIKLRTMRHGAEKASGAVWASEKDPRITRIGNFLRKTRLDEIPQVWNILKGEMSFVGPRSERPEFNQMLTQEVPFYEERYLIKPGATGWAQLQKSYYSSVTDTAEKLQYDLYYIKNRSVILDLGILLKTVALVLRAGGR